MKGERLACFAGGFLVGILGWFLVIDAMPVPWLLRRLETGAYDAGVRDTWSEAREEAKATVRWHDLDRQIEASTHGCASTDREILEAGFAAGVTLDVNSYRLGHHCPGIVDWRTVQVVVCADGSRMPLEEYDRGGWKLCTPPKKRVP